MKARQGHSTEQWTFARLVSSKEQGLRKGMKEEHWDLPPLTPTREEPQRGG